MMVCVQRWSSLRELLRCRDEIFIKPAMRDTSSLVLVLTCSSPSPPFCGGISVQKVFDPVKEESVSAEHSLTWV